MSLLPSCSGGLLREEISEVLSSLFASGLAFTYSPAFAVPLA